ncbi:MAG: PHP domain-containing protein [Ruminococcaceae bacterium]|nr:PHP domain-containing protein [Oscillospiraceae bacterium]
MIQDLHSHTYYSFCGSDRPEDVAEGAIAGGIELLGICDHSHGIGNARWDVFCDNGDLGQDYYRTLIRYFDHINLIAEKYADRIRILRGIEVCTHTTQKRTALPQSADISFFDYCLVENLDMAGSTVTRGDIFSYAERLGCGAVGIAHTDMFAFIESIGEKPYDYFKRMAEQGIFWEMNVSYDSIHRYREHPYMLKFFEDDEQQAIIRESGVRLSVGFDGHRIAEYRPDRVKEYCEKINQLGIKLAFE